MVFQQTPSCVCQPVHLSCTTATLLAPSHILCPTPMVAISNHPICHAVSCLHAPASSGPDMQTPLPSLLSSQHQQHASRLGSSAMPPPHLMLPARLSAPGRSPAGVLSIPFSIARASNKILPSKWLHTQSTESSRQMSSDAASFRKGSGHGLL